MRTYLLHVLWVGLMLSAVEAPAVPQEGPPQSDIPLAGPPPRDDLLPPLPPEQRERAATQMLLVVVGALAFILLLLHWLTRRHKREMRGLSREQELVDKAAQMLDEIESMATPPEPDADDSQAGS